MTDHDVISLLDRGEFGEAVNALKDAFHTGLPAEDPDTLAR